MSAQQAAEILSDTLQEVAERRTTLRRAVVVSRLALALARTIEVVDLNARIEFLEQMLKKRK
ncbi:hypothetical protein A2949_00090 [Candidatus Adlerbacteria bacterium RIFCSPLOWO2_01_FULL_54_21b]|uniref:Uncharacterized protein n=1 Tax=Candidatus Adlerbacteria bacterium RIFCSPLOWO2_01_FULL_54_21b TaxID=1797245 RepID=A0A1F4XY33_9BACT|nr:MAG: hypothetical protein A2949_00090 [Candidatus Adlerbacteria bacterium RIFCSPLOWO2_01_FULL_54_21b]